MAANPKYRTARHRVLALAGVLGLGWLIVSSLYTVDVTEYGAVSRFGDVVGIAETPGLKTKLPFDRVIRLNKRLLDTIPPQAEYLTIDKKNVVVHSLLTWRIVDPHRFLESAVIRANAEAQLADIVLAEIGSVLGTYAFDALINSVAAGGLADMAADIRDSANQVARPTYGIELVDLRVRQLLLPEQNKRYVYERMTAERGKIAMRHRSEGEREAQKIVAAADRERTRLLAEAYKTAQHIRGEADAEAIRIYAERFSRNPPFYKFLRTLQAYEVILDDQTTIFLPADAEVFQILHDGMTPER